VNCIRSLREQSLSQAEIVVVDNGGAGSVRAMIDPRCCERILEPGRNLGFGAAINRGWRSSTAPFIAVLNDDAIAAPGWLEALVEAMQSSDDVGACASQVRLADDGRLDSAGMLLCADGSSKQRGHLADPAAFSTREEVLLASGSAAMYRRRMLEETGGFDEAFFLYCEDTDLGLRAQWAGWRCLYVPEAVVEHRYSHSAGRASPLKAYYVERNRLLVALKNFPARMLLKMPSATMVRYWWHARYLFQGRGKAAEFREEGNSAFRLLWFVLRAYTAVLARIPHLAGERRRTFARRRISAEQFMAAADRFRISPKEVAAL
jgi:GT2 family glycosyltransferase